jgi:hypothetical protein
MPRRLREAQMEILAQDLTQLLHSSEDRLNDEFRRLYGLEPPARLRRSLLIRAIAYRLQEKALGGLKPATRRLLAIVAQDARARRSKGKPNGYKISAGMTLLREWHGVQHRLTVVEDGVQFGGQHYRSLSEVARKITGTRRSGPLFFGLKSPRVERHRGTE